MLLENEECKVEINSFGAEVRSVIKNGMEYMWQADPLYWKRTSPILFPFVGKLTDDEYMFEDKLYHVTQHGFARDHEFTLIESSKTKVSYLFTENSATLEKYPFHFNLIVEYELINNQLVINWNVKNTSDTAMYFQVGAHPAFNFSNGAIVDVNKRTNLYQLGVTPHITTIITDVDVSSFEIDNHTFKNDAVIYDNISHIRIRDESKSVEIKCDGFPYLGIWTKVKDGINAPFFCLEPWHGITDFVNHDKELTSKKGVINLSPNMTFEASYTIIFN